MDEFCQMFLINAIKYIITAILSYLPASKASNIQMKTIKEKNKVELESLKENICWRWRQKKKDIIIKLN